METVKNRNSEKAIEQGKKRWGEERKEERKKERKEERKKERKKER